MDFRHVVRPYELSGGPKRGRTNSASSRILPFKYRDDSAALTEHRVRQLRLPRRLSRTIHRSEDGRKLSPNWLVRLEWHAPKLVAELPFRGVFREFEKMRFECQIRLALNRDPCPPSPLPLR